MRIVLLQEISFEAIDMQMFPLKKINSLSDFMVNGFD